MDYKILAIHLFEAHKKLGACEQMYRNKMSIQRMKNDVNFSSFSSQFSSKLNQKGQQKRLYLGTSSHYEPD